VRLLRPASLEEERAAAGSGSCREPHHLTAVFDDNQFRRFTDVSSGEYLSGYIGSHSKLKIHSLHVIMYKPESGIPVMRS